MMEKRKAYLKPFILTAVLVVVDQLSKLWVINNIPEDTIWYSSANDLLWICHVRNTGVAFSMGAGGSTLFRMIAFVVAPVIVLGFICWVIATSKNILTKTQRWFAAGIVGGGIGTMIDRILRFDQGVVDFISVKFFGFFGMDRWPTFNVSDSCVVVFTILFLFAVIFGEKNGNK